MKFGVEVYSRLSVLGFTWCCLDELTVVEQLRLFRSARCIVSSHGAALTNLIACHEQTTVVELLPSYGNYSHYFLISDILKLRHGHVIGTIVDRHSLSFYVDPLNVIAILNQLEMTK